MPTLNFTVRGIESLKPSHVRTDYFDEGITGFGIRVSEKGRKTWFVMYRHHRRLRRMTFGTYPTMCLADANKRAKELLVESDDGKDPARAKQVERNAETFADLAVEYIERHAKKKKKSWENDDRILESDFLPELGILKAKDITRPDILRILDKISDRGAPIMANRSLEVVRKMFNFGIRRGIVTLNPCSQIDRPHKERQRDRVLSEEEIRKVWAAADQEPKIISTIVKLRLVTAQRGQELTAMRRQDLDLKGRWWTIPKEYCKNGLSHRVPLSDLAMEVLRDWFAEETSLPWVFPSPRGTGTHIEWVRKAVDRICETSKVDFIARDLRRTAASHMTGMGIPRLVVSKILNHVETGITAVYDRHSYDADKREAMEKWGKKFVAILNDTEEKAAQSS